MSGLKSLNRGKRGEREVVKILQRVVDKVYLETLNSKFYSAGEPGHSIEVYQELGKAPVIQRNTLQSDRGGQDMAGISFLAVEVKFCETYALPAWWRQTCAQATNGKIPVLFFRRSFVDWTVLTQGRWPAVPWHESEPLMPTQAMDLAAWDRMFEQALRCELAAQFARKTFGVW